MSGGAILVCLYNFGSKRVVLGHYSILLRPLYRGLSGSAFRLLGMLPVLSGEFTCQRKRL